MISAVGKAVLLLALPVVAFWGGTWMMSALSGRQEVRRVVEEAAQPGDRKPLGQRFRYDSVAADRYWGALGTGGRAAERVFLELDLVFPFLYGGALAASLLLAWAALGRGFQPAWVVAPVGLTLLADWTENLVQLAQLQRYVAHGSAALQSGWIHLASTATLVKLVAFGGSSVLLVVLVAILLARGSTPG